MPERKPITFEHLKQGLHLAMKSRLAGKAIEVTPSVWRKYDQHKWDCGTHCCAHGFACYVAREAPEYVYDDDYAEVPAELRTKLHDYLFSQHTSLPELINVVDEIDAQIGAQRP